MFGCYRRTEAADPATYVGAVALVFAHYSAAVVEAVTDPFGGLPARKNENGYSGLPDVAEVKQACEEEAARRLRMAEYVKLPKTNYPRLPAPRKSSPGAFANVLLRSDHPRHAEFMERTRNADPRDWKIDQRGLHVSYAWLEQAKTQYTAEELQKIYPSSEQVVAE